MVRALLLLVGALPLHTAQKGDIPNEPASTAAAWTKVDWPSLEADLWSKVRSSRSEVRRAAFLEWGTRGLNASDLMALTHGNTASPGTASTKREQA